MRQTALRALVLVGLMTAARPAAANIIFSDDFESGTGNWTLTGTWGLTTSRAHTASNSLTDSPDGNYSVSTNYTATKVTPFSLVGAVNPTLKYWAYQFTESASDTTNVEVSVTGGATWQLLRTRSGAYTTWTQTSLSLADYVGQSSVLIRFRLYSSSNYTYDGWYIDDVVIDDGITFSAVTVTSPSGTTSWAGGTTQQVTWTYDGTLTGASAFDVAYSLDGVTWASIATGLGISARSTTWTLPAATTSNVRVRVPVLDGSSAVLGTAYSPTFSIDSTPPTAFALDSPTNGGCVGSTPALSWSSAPGATRYKLTVTPSTGSAIAKEGLTSASYTFTAGEALSAAGSPYTWYVTALDAVGNATASSSWSFFIGSTGPSAFTLAAPAASAWVKPSSAFTWNAATASGCVGGTVTYTFYLDGSTLSCGSTSSGTSLNPTTYCTLADGTHTWAVKATDALGNVTWCSEAPGGVGGRTVRIDSTAPAGTTLTSPASGMTLGTTTPTFSWTAATDSGSGGVTYQLYVDSLAVGTPTTLLTMTPATSLTEGTHSWKVRVTDATGNYVDTPTWTFTTTSCVTGATETCAGSSVGICKPGTRTCNGGTWGSCVGAVYSSGETCNGLDDDCDSLTDEGLTGCVNCAAGSSQNCYTGPSGSAGVGVCKSGTQSCTNGLWGSCTGQTVPGTEICDSQDNDCDGQTDEKLTSCACTATEQACYAGPGGTTGVGACKAGQQSCSLGVWGECIGSVLPAAETCNGIDEDCDGQTDEDLGSCDAGGNGGGGNGGGGGQSGTLDGGLGDTASHVAQDGGCGCSTGGAGAPAAFLLLGLGMVLALRRRAGR